MNTRRVLAALLAVPALATTGCTGDGSSDASKEPSAHYIEGPPPTAPPGGFAEFPVQIWDAVEAPTEAGDFRTFPAELQPFTSESVSMSGVATTVPNRRIFGCDNAPRRDIPVDADGLDFDEAIARLDGGKWIVHRQVTLYRTIAAAEKFAVQWADANARCDTYAGHSMSGFYRSDFTEDRSFGIKGDFEPTQVSRGDVTTDDGPALVWVDIVSRRGNAVVLTRVADPDHHDADVTEQVRLQGDRANEILALFGS